MTSLRRTGRLEEVDAALVKLGRVVADDIDAANVEGETRYVRNGLYRTMLTAIAQLRDSTGPIDDTDTFDTLLASLVEPAHTDTPD